eukprot:g6786.t1 g6786   contig23:1209076-1210092(-)
MYRILIFCLSAQSPFYIDAAFASHNHHHSSLTHQPSTLRRTQQLHLAPQQLGEFEPITLSGNDGQGRTQRKVWLYDFVTASNSLTVPYHAAWDLQKSIVEHQLARIGKSPKDPALYEQFIPFDSGLDQSGGIPQSLLGCDSIIMLEHDPVYTLGTASDPSFIHGYQKGDDDEEEVNTTIDNDAATSIPIVRIERGGEVTYHGPGQLVVYPIIDLRGYKQDIHWYMRALEEVIIIALEKAGVKGATREDNLTGVWIHNKKIAALGIKARRWVTMHGLAINVDVRSLQNFEGIVPCGLEGRKVTCINDEVATGDCTVGRLAVHVKEAFEEILGVSLVSPP